MRRGQRGASCAALLAIAATFVCATDAGAIAAGQRDTFEGGTTLGWRHGSPSTPLPPTNIEAGGPAGADDNYLLIQTDGSESGSASRLLTMNTAQWLGDYLAAGVGAIELDARNFNNAELVVRLGFRGANGSLFVTNGIALAAATDWTHLTFDLSESNMALASGTYADCFGGVTMVRILHNPFTPATDSGEPVRDAGGIPVPAQLGLDNITAIPEPAAAVLLALLAPVVARRRNCRLMTPRQRS